MAGEDPEIMLTDERARKRELNRTTCQAFVGAIAASKTHAEAILNARSKDEIKTAALSALDGQVDLPDLAVLEDAGAFGLAREAPHGFQATLRVLNRRRKDAAELAS